MSISIFIVWYSILQNALCILTKFWCRFWIGINFTFEWINLAFSFSKMIRYDSIESFQANSIWSEIIVLKCSSNFYHLIVSMRSISCKFQLHSSILSLFLAVLSFRDCQKISGLQISLIFRDSFFQIAFAVSLTGAIPESSQRIVSKTFRTKSWKPFYLW